MTFLEFLKILERKCKECGKMMPPDKDGRCQMCGCPDFFPLPPKVDSIKDHPWYNQDTGTITAPGAK